MKTVDKVAAFVKEHGEEKGAGVFVLDCTCMWSQYGLHLCDDHDFQDEAFTKPAEVVLAEMEADVIIAEAEAAEVEAEAEQEAVEVEAVEEAVEVEEVEVEEECTQVELPLTEEVEETEAVETELEVEAELTIKEMSAIAKSLCYSASGVQSKAAWIALIEQIKVEAGSQEVYQQRIELAELSVKELSAHAKAAGLVTKGVQKKYDFICLLAPAATVATEEVVEVTEAEVAETEAVTVEATEAVETTVTEVEEVVEEEAVTLTVEITVGKKQEDGSYLLNGYDAVVRKINSKKWAVEKDGEQVVAGTTRKAAIENLVFALVEPKTEMTFIESEVDVDLEDLFETEEVEEAMAEEAAEEEAVEEVQLTINKDLESFGAIIDNKMMSLEGYRVSGIDTGLWIIKMSGGWNVFCQTGHAIGEGETSTQAMMSATERITKRGAKEFDESVLAFIESNKQARPQQQQAQEQTAPPQEQQQQDDAPMSVGFDVVAYAATLQQRIADGMSAADFANIVFQEIQHAAAAATGAQRGNRPVPSKKQQQQAQQQSRPQQQQQAPQQSRPQQQAPQQQQQAADNMTMPNRKYEVTEADACQLPKAFTEFQSAVLVHRTPSAATIRTDIGTFVFFKNAENGNTYIRPVYVHEVRHMTVGYMTKMLFAINNFDSKQVIRAIKEVANSTGMQGTPAASAASGNQTPKENRRKPKTTTPEGYISVGGTHVHADFFKAYMTSQVINDRYGKQKCLAVNIIKEWNAQLAKQQA